MPTSIIADIHCHSTLRLFYGNHGIWWDKRQTDSARDNDFLFLKPHSVFDSLLKSRVRLIFLSLYSIEQGFLSNLISHNEMHDLLPLSDGRFEDFLIKRIDNMIEEGGLGENIRKLLARFIGIKKNHFFDIISDNHNYFTKLQEEYSYLLKEINKNKKAQKNLKIAGNFSDVRDALALDPNLDSNMSDNEKIAIVLTIEGSHALGSGVNSLKDLSKHDLNDIENGRFKKTKVQALYDQIQSNILTLKNWNNGAHCPFFITFAHHFWNHLAGHSMSLANKMHLIFDQNKGMNEPITELGKKVIHDLLSRENGRRILIDTKHMSVDVKHWFYDMLRNHNLNNPDDKIPVISSHSAVSGKPDIDTWRNTNDHTEMDQRYLNDTNNLFNCWDMNLSDEEIRIIHSLGGLIGLNFDQRVLSGERMVKHIMQYNVKEDDPMLFNAVWAEPVMQNILHIAKIIYESDIPEKDTVWEMISIGSDFDGMINPLDAYCYPADFEKLREMLILKLEMRQEWDTLLKDKNINELVDGFMYKNALKFLQKHFN